MNHYDYLLSYSKDNWPIIAFVLVAFGGGVAWLKKQLLDNVFATKAEVRAMTDELEDKMAAHEEKVDLRYTEIKDLIGDNHDEMKDLVISLVRQTNG